MRLSFLIIILFTLSSCSNNNVVVKPSPKKNIKQQAWEDAQCKIVAEGKIQYNKECFVLNSKKAEFSIKPKKSDFFYSTITMLSLTLIDVNKYHVRGLTSYGNNSYFGDASKSDTSSNCWIGNDFTICIN